MHFLIHLSFSRNPLRPDVINSLRLSGHRGRRREGKISLAQFLELSDRGTKMPNDRREKGASRVVGNNLSYGARAL